MFPRRCQQIRSNHILIDQFPIPLSQRCLQVVQQISSGNDLKPKIRPQVLGHPPARSWPGKRFLTRPKPSPIAFFNVGGSPGGFSSIDRFKLLKVAPLKAISPSSGYPALYAYEYDPIPIQNEVECIP